MNKVQSYTDKTTEEVVVEALNNENYPVTIKQVDRSRVMGVSLKDGENEITSLLLKHTDSAKNLKVVLKKESGEISNRYFVLISGKYYEMHINNNEVIIDSEDMTEIPSTDGYTISLAKTGLNGLVKINNEEMTSDNKLVNDGDIIKITPTPSCTSGAISLSVTGVDEVTILNVKINLNIRNGLIVSNYNKAGLTWEIYYIGKIDEQDSREEEHVYLISKQNAKTLQIGSFLTPYNGISDFLDETEDSNGIKRKDYFTPVQNGLLSLIYKNGEIVHSNVGNLDNLKATEYLLDSVGVWNNDYLDDGNGENGYGLYAFGGPTIDLLAKSIEQAGYEKLDYSWYVSTGSRGGYKMSNYGCSQEKLPMQSLWWTYYGRETAYYLAGPHLWDGIYGFTYGDGLRGCGYSTFSKTYTEAVRPVICLKPEYTVVSDSQHSGQFKIVQK